MTASDIVQCAPRTMPILAVLGTAAALTASPAANADNTRLNNGVVANVAVAGKRVLRLSR
jgi:hypothetical protein